MLCVFTLLVFQPPNKTRSISIIYKMAELLGIAASVAGLLSVAVKISTTVTAFASAMSDVPDSARDLLATVDGIWLTLSSVKKLLDSILQVPRERKELIHVPHLFLVFRETIISISELESIVCPSGVEGYASTWHRLKWVLEEKRISSVVQRVESHRTSLSTMLSILQW
jgi:hypothetical protein